MLPRDINAIIKEEVAEDKIITTDNSRERYLPKLEIFSKGKTPVELAIALNITKATKKYSKCTYRVLDLSE
jgi:hypothetical protein